MSTPEKLPVPPLRLRRIFLHGIGPDGARFDPLDLDFNTPDGAASRALLSLVNTGGKSTLITLVSSLIVPAAREQVGGKILGDFVLTGDTSHIVCEWEDSTTGVRTVTGTVMEWKDGRRQPGGKLRSTTNMHRSWYLFRTGEGLPGIDDLPFIDDAGRRSTYAGYTSALDDLLGQYPDTWWAHIRTQQEWTQALLDHTSIDPVLFGYQMRMNDDEAGAKALLQPFSSDDNVIRFFIGALNDDRDFAEFTNQLGAYAGLAADRPKLLALNAFFEEIRPPVATIAHRADELKEASAVAINDRTSCAEFAGAVVTRLTGDRERLEEQSEEVAAAEQRASTARTKYNQISDIRLQLALERAKAELVAAEDDLRERTAESVASENEAAAWLAVQAVLDIETAREARDAAELAYAVADAGLGPLREQSDAAAGALAGRLVGLIAENGAVAEAAEARAAAAETAEDTAVAQSKDAARRRADADRHLNDIDATTRAAAAAAEAARTAGWLYPGETEKECLRRWQELRAAGKADEEEAARAAETAEQARREAENAKDALDGELRVLQQVTHDHQRALEEFDRDFAKISTHPGVERLLGGPALTGTEIGRAQELAVSGAHRADRTAADHQKLADAAQEELRHFDETGTAPAGVDVLAVVDALGGFRIGAVTGLQWIENNIVGPDDRRAFIIGHPDVAGGVIVTDPAKLSEAERRLSELNLRTRTPVAVVANPSLAKAKTADGADGRFIVIPHRATWDREWAQAARVEYADTAERESAAALRARDDAKLHRAAEQACVAFLDRWSTTRRDDLAAAAAESAAAVAAADDKRNELIAERDRQHDLAAQSRTKAEQARTNFSRADQFVVATQTLMKKSAEADSAAQRRVLVEAERRTAVEDENAAEAAKVEARGIREHAGGEAARAHSDITTARRELNGLGVEVPGPDPGGALDVVRRRYESLRQELSTAERGMQEAEWLDRAKAELSKAQGRANNFDAHVLARAAELSVLPAASSSDSLVAAQRRARETADVGHHAKLRAEQHKSTAEADLRAAQPREADRQNHVDLSNFPEWIPGGVGEIPALMERLEHRNIEMRELMNKADQAKAEAVALLAGLKEDVEHFEETVELWLGDPAGGQPALPGPRRDARRAMRELVERHKKSDTRERDMVGALNDAVAVARTVVNNPRWKDLDSHVVLRLRGLRDRELIAEALSLGENIHGYALANTADLETLEIHRNIVRDGLVALCREQRRLLREVSASSRLPAGLGTLSGQPAIKIGFQEASEEEARGRLGDRVDAWALELADNPKRAASSEVRTRWLAEAVRETVLDRIRAGSWSIEILKPRIDGQMTYCSPDRIVQEFSGGQVLTLAVLVYCALSRVRSAHRTGGSRPAGTLLLDNPFGAASAETLLRMQHQLAAHSGIQLVCATGLNEPTVERAFSDAGSVIVKLRNDGDQRRNQHFLRIREQFVGGIDLVKAIGGDRPADSPQNWVEGIRYAVQL